MILELSRLNLKVFDKSYAQLTHLYTPSIIIPDQDFILSTLGAKTLALANQVHGQEVAYASDKYIIKDADALVTDQAGVALGIKTADCVCALLASADSKVIGAVHLGWRSAISELLANTIKMMRQFSAATILAYIAPCIRQKSYQVQQDLYQLALKQKPMSEFFFSHVAAKPNDQIYFDLPGLVKCELNMLGITNIRDDGIDTYTSQHCFSYRAASHRGITETGRMLSCIALR